MQRNPSCPNCCKSFRGQDPVGSLFPLMLHCGHTFCRSCLVKFMKMTRSHIICPVCKTTTPTPLKETSIGELAPDFYILGVLLTNSKKKINQKGEGKFVPMKSDDSVEIACNIPEVFKQFKEKVTGDNNELCTECMKKPATCLCENCECILCGTCFNRIHENSRILMMHQATPLQPKTSSTTCSSHSKPLDFYCLEDMQAVCANCVIIGSHKGHSVQSIEERNKEVIHDLQPAIKKSEETMKAMLLAKKTICEAMPEVKHDAAKVMTEVRTHFTRLHSILQAREMLLIDRVETYLETQFETIKQVQKLLETNLSCILGAISEAKKAINSNKAIQTTQLLALLEATTDLPSLMEIPSSENKLQFKPGLEELSDVIANYGEVEGFDSDRYTLRAFSEVPEEVSRCQTLSSDDQVLIDRMVMETLSSFKESAGSQSVDEEVESTCSSSHTNQSKAESNAARARRPLRQRTYIQREPPGEKVMVTHIRNPWDFMVQRLADQDKVNNMMGYLQKYCRAPADKEHTVGTLSIGTMVCSQYSFDKKWYRSIIMTMAKSNPDEDDELESKDDTASELSVGSASMKSGTSAKAKDGYYEVVYIDYGNTEWVPLTSIRKMCPKYKKMPELSLRCSLKDIVPARNKSHWSKAAVHAFAEMTDNKQLHMTTVGKEGSILYVDLHEVLVDMESEAPASLRDALVFLELACFISQESICREPQKKSASIQYFAPDLPYRNDYVDVMVSHVNSPHNFYVQEIVLGDQYLKTMMDELQTKYNNSDSNLRVMCPHVGMVCVAKYLDDFWYRTQVVGLPGEGKVDVMYIDFGNVSRVHVSDVRMMAPNFLKLPIQAIACTMVDVAPIASSWDEGSATRLAEMSSTPLVISVQNVKDDVVSVLLYAPQQKGDSSCLNAVLVAEGFAKSTGPGSINAAVFKKYKKKETSQSSVDSQGTSKTEYVNIPVMQNAEAVKKTLEKKKLPYVGVRISHVVSPSCLYVQLKMEGKNGLESLQKEMMEHFLKTEVDNSEWKVDDIGAMIYSSNDFYSRAKIAQLLPENKAKVEMIDYGNFTVVTLSKLRRLAPDLSSVQPFAIRCHLANVFPAGGKDWTKTACEYLACKLEELELYILKEDEMNEDGSFPIDLLYKKSWKELAKDADTPETELISELLINYGLALPSPQRKKQRRRVQPKVEKESDEEAFIARSRLSKYCSSGVDIKQEEPVVTKLDRDSSPELMRKEDEGSSSILEEHHLPEVDQESQCSNNGICSDGILSGVERRKEEVGDIHKENLPLGSTSDHEYDYDAENIYSDASSSVCSIHSSGKGSRHQSSLKSQSPDKCSVHSISKDSVHSISKDGVHSISRDSVHSISRDSVHSIGKDSVHSTSRDSVHSIGRASVHSVGKDSVHSISRDSVHSIGRASIHSVGKSSVHSISKDSVPSIGRTSVHSISKDSVHSIGKDSVQSINSVGKGSVRSVGKDSVHSIGKDPSITKGSDHSVDNSSVQHSDDGSVHVSARESAYSGSGHDDNSVCLSDEKNVQISDKGSVRSQGNYVQTVADNQSEGSYIPDNNSVRSSEKKSAQNSTKSSVQCSTVSSVQSSAYNSDASCEPTGSSDNAIDSRPAPQPQRPRTIADKFQKIDCDKIMSQKSSNIADYNSLSDVSSSDVDDEVIAGIIARTQKRNTKSVASRHQTSSPRRSRSPLVAAKSVPYVQYSPFEMPTSNPCDIVVTFINERGIIYGHEISEGKTLLKEIMQELQEICCKSPVETAINWKPGQACFAHYSLDGLWYRAKVLSVQDDVIWVQYVDFGNSESVTGDKLRMATRFTDVPHQCLECILYGSRIVNTANCWPTDGLKFMYDNLPVCRIERKGIWHRGLPLLVDVTMPNRQNLRDALLNGVLYNSQDVIFCDGEGDYRIDAARLSAMSEDERAYYLGNNQDDMSRQDAFFVDSDMEFITMELPDPGVLFDVTITHADAPNRVYIQHFQGHTENQPMRECISQLNQLIEMNAEIHHLAPSWPPVTAPYVGLCCAGLYGQDNQWYRAKVLKVSAPNIVTVQYVDFGTPERVTIHRLRYLPVEYFDLPIQSILCEVYGLLPPSDIAEDCEMLPTTDWPLSSLTRLLEVIANREQVASVVTNGAVPSVCLYHGFVATSTIASMQAIPSNYMFLPLVDENLAELPDTNIESGSEV